MRAGRGLISSPTSAYRYPSAPARWRVSERKKSRPVAAEVPSTIRRSDSSAPDRGTRRVGSEIMRDPVTRSEIIRHGRDQGCPRRARRHTPGAHFAAKSRPLWRKPPPAPPACPLAPWTYSRDKPAPAGPKPPPPPASVPRGTVDLLASVTGNVPRGTLHVWHPPTARRRPALACCIHHAARSPAGVNPVAPATSANSE